MLAFGRTLIYVVEVEVEVDGHGDAATDDVISLVTSQRRLLDIQRR